MTSIDELFKGRSASGNQKRKADPTRDPNEIYKAAKLGANGDVKSNGKATVEDEVEEDEYAGPALPPDEEEELPDDEEGRFFGGGITKDTADVLDFIDERDDEAAAPEKIDSAWLRRLALNFEKRISKNAELRAKFENEPQKFMASEADLDADIKSLSILSEHPELYEEFAKLGCVTSLVSLLAHENTDIAIDAIQIISELTDEDVEAEESQWSTIVNAMLDADVVGLLTSNLSRLDEENEADRNGVYHVLSVLENFASQNSIAERIGQDSSVLSWLQTRIQRKESPLGQNKQYAAEILAILLQSSVKNQKSFVKADGLDILLQLLSGYRLRDPAKDSDEEEYVENLFDCLICLVDEDDAKDKFVEGEGIELCQIMLREGKFSKSRALRVLDHALGGQAGGAACERFVEAAGLKTVFGMFMKKQEKQTIEHLLGIFASLLRSLPGGSGGRIRVLAKFVEKDYAKIQKLVSLRREHSARLAVVDKAIQQERKVLQKEDQEDMAPEWLSRRFDAGLFSLQTIDVILAWLIAEDDGAKAKVETLLADQDESLDLIKKTLQEQLDGIDEADPGSEGQNMKEMLGTLLQFV